MVHLPLGKRHAIEQEVAAIGGHKLGSVATQEGYGVFAYHVEDGFAVGIVIPEVQHYRHLAAPGVGLREPTRKLVLERQRIEARARVDRHAVWLQGGV